MGAGNRIIAVTATTYDKALELNLDPQVYGTFAEIGAGQESANWFFRASGTAGLVAKTISAYDMTMSDAIYGRASRYVSADRLAAMLDHEYAIQLERLAPKRGRQTTFFSFCNTVRARGWQDSGECHGWLVPPCFHHCRSGRQLHPMRRNRTPANHFPPGDPT